MSIILRFLKPFLLSIIALVSLLLIQAFCDLNLPNYLSKMINLGILPQNLSYVWQTGLFMLFIALIGGLATVIVGLLASRIAAGVAKNLRQALFRHITDFSPPEFARFGTASLITRSTNDITQIQMVLTIGLRLFFYAPLMAFGGIFMALQKSISMSWIIALACLVLVCLVGIIFSLTMRKFQIIQTFLDRLNLIAKEQLSGLLVIRAFGTQAFEEKRFEKANLDLTQANLFVNRAFALLMPAMMLIMNGIAILIVWISAPQIAEARLQVGDMMAFIQYAMQIIMSFLMISMLFVFVPRALVSAKRIDEVLSTISSITDPKQPQAFIPEQLGKLEFKQVSFCYPHAKQKVLDNISFVAEAGKTTAIVGPTGSGKSTLVNLIPRFYDVSSGQILFNGVNLKDLRQSDLRHQLGFVPQAGALFSGTIASNLKYGQPTASLDELEKASQIAQIQKFIDQKPEGFATKIATGGHNVSGGQRQRLSIARALVRKAQLYIFDDSFSALDAKTDLALRTALKKHIKNSTVLIVSQRVSTIMHADKIIVLDQGQLIAQGTHKQLLKTCPLYHEIAVSQLATLAQEGTL